MLSRGIAHLLRKNWTGAGREGRSRLGALQQVDALVVEARHAGRALAPRREHAAVAAEREADMDHALLALAPRAATPSLLRSDPHLFSIMRRIRVYDVTDRHPNPWQVVRCKMKSIVVYAAAAIAEIAGCFAFWVWLRDGASPWWLLPGILSLAVFAWLLTLVETAAAGRAYAAYGGLYIVAAIAWLWAVEGVRPDRWDVTGAAVCLAGAAIILWGPRLPQS